MSPVICLIGTVTNTVCFLVLRRTGMRTPINLALTWLCGTHALGMGLQAAITYYDQVLTDKNTDCRARYLVNVMECLQSLAKLSLGSNSWLIIGIAFLRIYMFISESGSPSFELVKVVLVICGLFTLLESLSYFITITVVSYRTNDNMTCFRTDFREWTDRTIYKRSNYAFSYGSTSLQIISSSILVVDIVYVYGHSCYKLKVYHNETLVGQVNKRFREVMMAQSCVSITGCIAEGLVILHSLYDFLQPDHSHLTLYDFFDNLTYINMAMTIVYLSISSKFRTHLKKLILGQNFNQHKYTKIKRNFSCNLFNIRNSDEMENLTPSNSFCSNP